MFILANQIAQQFPYLFRIQNRGSIYNMSKKIHQHKSTWYIQTVHYIMFLHNIVARAHSSTVRYGMV